MIKPISATLEITSKCNIQCKHCFAESIIDKNAPEIYFQELKSLIDDLLDLGVSNFLIIGGEPTVHNDFFKVIQYFTDKGISPGFSTNGLLLTKQFCENLYQLGIKHNVYVSLDGLDKESYKQIRGKDRFEKVVEGINNLRNAKIKFGISSVVVKQNYRQVDQIYMLAENLGASLLNLIRFNVEGRGVKYENELGIKVKDFYGAANYLIEKHGGFIGFWGENCIIPIEKKIKKKMRFPKEEDLRQYLVIRATGDVYLGRASGGVKIGNFHDSQLSNIWNRQENQHYFQNMTSFEFNNLIAENIRFNNKNLL